MTDPVETSVELAGAIRAYWESMLAPLYSSADLREKKRGELIELRGHLQRREFDLARPIVEEWRMYHKFNGEFADTLMMGFRHLKLAGLFQELLDLFPAE